METVSKKDRRNRLLNLIVEVDKHTKQQHDSQMDEDAQQSDEDRNDYDQIMRSNFSMCTSTFANYNGSCGSGGGVDSDLGSRGGGAGPGGGGGGGYIDSKFRVFL